MIRLRRRRDGSIEDQNSATLERLVIDTGGVTTGMRTGTATVHFAAAQFSNTVTVPHGLGKTPTRYGAWGNSGAGIEFGCSNPTSTTIDVRAGYWPAAITQDAVCTWVVYG